MLSCLIVECSCIVYAKTIIHLSICVYWGIAPETEDGGAAIPHYSLHFGRIIVHFDFKINLPLCHFRPIQDRPKVYLGKLKPVGLAY